MNKLEVFASEQLKETVPSFNIGDTVRVHNRIKEGTRDRDGYKPVAERYENGWYAAALKRKSEI